MLKRSERGEASPAQCRRTEQKIERPGERFNVKPIRLAECTIAGVTHSLKDVEALKSVCAV